MDEHGEVLDVEVEDLGAWIAGFSEETGAVALVIRTTEGEQLGVLMPPAEAIKMGAVLSRLGLQASPAANA